MELSIIVPAYNEETRISKTLHDYIRYFEPVYGDNFELLVITDGCKDRTCEVISEIGSDNIRHYNFKERLGKGGAISKGYRLSKGAIVSYTDADGSISPDQLSYLINVLNTSDCDGVAASRYIEGGSTGGSLPLTRWITSRAYNLMVRSLFALPYKDTQCGAKVFRDHVAHDIFEDLKITDWAFDVNLLNNAHKRGYVVKEVGIEWKDSPGSNVKLYRVVPKMFLSTFRLRLLDSRLSFLAENKWTRSISLMLKGKWGNK